jgi:hypothetical protein
VTTQLHPDAAKNFDKKARVLLAAVAPESPQEPSEPPTDMFRPGGHVVATFGEEDYLEFKITVLLPNYKHRRTQVSCPTLRERCRPIRIGEVFAVILD